MAGKYSCRYCEKEMHKGSRAKHIKTEKNIESRLRYSYKGTMTMNACCLDCGLLSTILLERTSHCPYCKRTLFVSDNKLVGIAGFNKH